MLKLIMREYRMFILDAVSGLFVTIFAIENYIKLQPLPRRQKIYSALLHATFHSDTTIPRGTKAYI